MTGSGDNWQRLESLLDRLLDRPAETREAWLQDHCDDPVLRAQAVAILAADAARGAGIEALATTGNPWAAAEDSQPPALPEVPGYNVLELLGEGGMASVFLAEREVAGGVQRVALKRLRLSVHDPVERRRFEAEQRILARLEHPGIARFIDAGIAADGVPWYAMEYVEGQSLVAWCDTRQSSVEQRLEFIVDVCRAVHYAHQHLVIHRDIKPSNILVDASGSIKLLDFGVAKLLDPDTDRAESTRTEHRRLTPAYAAPEQFEGIVSTASDIYALGVLLMETTSGQRPRVAVADTTEDRFGKLAISDGQAAVRQSSPSALIRLLAGALGSIARKAMRKEPELRYGSAQAMAEDIQAWRQGLPVDARRGDWLYRAGCFVRRHALGVAVAAILIAVLLGATAFSLRQANRANTQAEISSVVQGVMEDMLGPLYESLPPDQSPKMEALVDNSVAKLADGDDRKPAVQAELLAMFARTYDRIGRKQQALELARRSYDFNVASFGAGDSRSLQALAMRGRLKHQTGDAKGALADLEAAVAAMQDQGIGGRAYLQAIDNLAFVAEDLGDHERGIRLLNHTLNERIRQFGPASIEVAAGNSKLADLHIGSGQSAAAIPYLEQAYNGYLQHGDRRRAALHLATLGKIRNQSGHDRDGAADIKAALALFDQLKGAEHPVPQSALDTACVIHQFIDDFAAAEASCRRAAEIAERIHGTGSKEHSLALIHYSKVWLQQGRPDKTREIILRERARRVANGATESEIDFINFLLSFQQVVAGDWQAMRDGLLPRIRGNSLVGSQIAPMVLARLALACHFAPSEACPAELVARADRAFALPYFANATYLHIEPLLNLAQLALAQDDPQAAMMRLRKIEALSSREDSSVTGDHYLLKVAAMLRGEAEAALGHPEEALRQLRIAETGFVSRGFPADHPYRLRVAENLRRLEGPGFPVQPNPPDPSRHAPGPATPTVR